MKEAFGGATYAFLMTNSDYEDQSPEFEHVSRSISPCLHPADLYSRNTLRERTNSTQRPLQVYKSSRGRGTKHEGDLKRQRQSRQVRSVHSPPSHILTDIPLASKSELAPRHTSVPSPLPSKSSTSNPARTLQTTPCNPRRALRTPTNSSSALLCRVMRPCPISM